MQVSGGPGGPLKPDVLEQTSLRSVSQVHLEPETLNLGWDTWPGSFSLTYFGLFGKFGG